MKNSGGTRHWPMLSAIVVVAVGAIGAVKLAAQEGPPPGGNRRGPPPEMLKACSAKASGDICSAIDRQGQSVAGTCFAPQGRPLACRPQGGPPDPEGGRQDGGGQRPEGAPSGSAQGSEIATTRVDTSAILCGVRANTLNTSINLQSSFAWTCANGKRSLVGNGIPDHVVGAFPNANNPNKISVQMVSFSASLKPVARQGEGRTIKEPGYAINGIKFDPGTGGACPSSMTSKRNCDLGRPVGAWRMEALGQSSFNFGVDGNNAHVQPGGEYHYHGLPTGLMPAVTRSGQRMALVGWAGDGYPMYALYGYANPKSAKSALRKMRGSYQLKSKPDAGRPSVGLVPMGTFMQDFHYVAGSGDLDECNGRFDVTPEFPKGIYHYYVTDSYPYVQRCVKGTASNYGPSGPPPGRS
jgi:hypothetical protein